MKQWKPKDIKALRKKLKLSQQVFGDLVGVTRTYVNLMERGVKTPSKSLRLLLDCVEGKLKKKKEEIWESVKS